MQVLRNEHEQKSTAAKLTGFVRQFAAGALERVELQQRDLELLAELKAASAAFVLDDIDRTAVDVEILAAEIAALSTGTESRVVAGVHIGDVPAIKDEMVRHAIAAKCAALVIAVEASERVRLDKIAAEKERQHAEDDALARLAKEDSITFHLVSALAELFEQRIDGAGDPNSERELGRVVGARLVHMNVAIGIDRLPDIFRRMRIRKVA